MTDERRQHERIPVELLFSYEIQEVPPGVELEPGKTENPVLVNISRGGACILSAQSLAKGVCLKISITPLLVPGIMRLIGTVVWAEAVADSTKCGIRFERFEEGSEAVFDQYMTKLETTPPEEVARLIKEAEEMEEF